MLLSSMVCMFRVETEVVMGDMITTFVSPIKCTYQFVLAIHL